MSTSVCIDRFGFKLNDPLYILAKIIIIIKSQCDTERERCCIYETGSNFNNLTFVSVGFN